MSVGAEEMSRCGGTRNNQNPSGNLVTITVRVGILRLIVDIKIDYGDTSHDTQPASTAPVIVTCTLNFSR
jgi:hypothetical protein